MTTNQPKLEVIRNHAETLERLIKEVCPEGLERKMALTNVSLAVMWANLAIVRADKPQAEPGITGMYD